MGVKVRVILPTAGKDVSFVQGFVFINVSRCRSSYRDSSIDTGYSSFFFVQVSCFDTSVVTHYHFAIHLNGLPNPRPYPIGSRAPLVEESTERPQRDPERHDQA
jgi:hypothetical protein